MQSLEIANVIGFVPGKRKDSIVVFTAHYDHLGMMGTALFPGASDNASGTSMLLDLAHHYSKEKPEFTTWFICFAGEEAGLAGSKFFVDNPQFDLSSVKLLLNLDLMGSAAEGIAVVNGKKYPQMIEKLSAINSEQNLVGRIKVRGQAANSDHYWFAERGVPAIFIYTMGNITAYHDVYDTSQVVDWAKYPEVFTLITEFVSSL
jgi:Zn-dependent M28 family amino/carboxypeptidase